MKDNPKPKADRFELLFRNMNQGAAVFRTEDGHTFRLTDLNAAAETIGGVSRDDVIGKRVETILSGTGTVDLPDALRRVWKDGAPEPLPAPADGDKVGRGWRLRQVLKISDHEVVGLFDDRNRVQLLEDELVQTTWALNTRNECNKAIIEAESETDFLNRICRILSDFGGYPLSWIGLIDQATELFSIAAEQYTTDLVKSGRRSLSSPSDSERSPAKKRCPAINDVLRSGRPQRIEDIFNHENCRHWYVEAERLGCRSCLVVPLSVEHRPLGTLIVQSRRFGDFDEREVRHLQELADDIARGVENLRLRIRNLRISEERNRLSTAVEQIAESMIITDREGKIRYVNAAFAKTSGYTDAEAIGQPFWFNIDDDMETNRLIPRVVNVGDSWSGRYRKKRKEGSHYQVDAAVSPVFNREGTVENVIVIERDITHEIRLENQLRQSQKLEAIGTLAGGIAHDFNNLLFAMNGYMTLCRNDLPPESPLRGYLEKALQAGKRSEDLVRQILTFARQYEDEVHPLQLTPLVKEVMKMMRSLLPATIEFKLELRAGADIVAGSPSQLYQMLVNLCSNAGYAMGEKGGLLTIVLENIEVDPPFAEVHDLKAGSHVQLSVSDTGTGIPAADLGKIFDPFFTTKPVDEGTGLGLALVHGIVTSSGGAIRVESQPGRGTRFDIYLPLVEPPDRAGGDQALPAPGGTEHILVIDDEDAVATLVQLILEGRGYRVTVSNSSLAALELFRQHPDRFDLVLTDQSMPQIAGAQLSQEIRKRRPHLPIILMTGYSHQVASDNSPDFGISCFLQKPVDDEDLCRAVRAMLDREPA